MRKCDKMKADQLFINGKIHTLEREDTIHHALVVHKGIIVFVGEEKEALQKYTAKEVIDLKGKLLLPGLGDSHIHLYAYAKTLTMVDLSPAKSREDLVDLLRKKAEKTPKGMWIQGTNFDQTKWFDSEELPTKNDLDRATKDHPIWIKRVCLHTSVANTLAMEMVKEQNPEIFTGQGSIQGLIGRDDRGCLNGIFREQAGEIVDRFIPDPLEDWTLRREVLSQTLQRASSLGMTMMHTYGAKIWKYKESLEDYRALEKEGLLPLRVTVYSDTWTMGESAEKNTKNNPEQKVRYGGYKMFCDGSLGSRTAKLFESYEDDPGNDGVLTISPERLKEELYQSDQKGRQTAIHSIGDKALECVLDAIDDTLQRSREDAMTREERERRLPFRIIHAQLAGPDQIRRMKTLPVILDIQPSFLMTDLYWIEDRIGKKRAKDSYPWKSYLQAGLMVTGGSDCPVEDFSPWKGMYAAVTRKDENHPERPGFHPEEKLSLYQALCLFSKNIPYATGEEGTQGTLEVGKYADMMVLDRDIFNDKPETLLEVQVEKTYLAGEEVFSRDSEQRTAL